MKTIGMLGGTGWSSTIEYYKIINEIVHARLGGYHSAKILLKSIDYHQIMSNYGKNDDEIALILKTELAELLKLKPESLIVCCNSLHKYYDLVKRDLELTIPMFHAVELTAKYIKEKNYKNVLLLATRFTMEDGFFAKTLEQKDIQVTIPIIEEREMIQEIHADLMKNIVTEHGKKYFKDLINKYKSVDAVILGCSEFPMVVSYANTQLPIVDPIYLQCQAAVDYSL
ncbi:MAG: amino acid racemase [Proteobacteria bacterium]|nr:amino acid racemase [Pseudomonadota bacterium]